MYIGECEHIYVYSGGCLYTLYACKKYVYVGKSVSGILLCDLRGYAI